MRCARRFSSGTGRTDGNCRGGATRRRTTGRLPASTALVRPAHQRRRLPRPRQWLLSQPTACGSPRSCASRRASRPYADPRLEPGRHELAPDPLRTANDAPARREPQPNPSPSPNPNRRSFRTGSRGWRHSRLSRRSPRRARRRSTRAGRGWASTGGHAFCTREASRRARSAATAAALLHLPPPPPPLRSPSRLPRYQGAHHSTHLSCTLASFRWSPTLAASCPPPWTS